MKKLFPFVLGLLLFFSPLAVQAEEIEIMPQEEIAEAPAIVPLTEAEINELLDEDPYIGETNWRGKKVSTKRDYTNKKIKRPLSHLSTPYSRKETK